MKGSIVAFILFASLFSCRQLKVEEALFKQYGFLLERSVKFDYTNREFKNELRQFIDTCTEYNMGIEKRVNPFESNVGITPVLLYPYFFNNKQDELVVMVLSKNKEMDGALVDYVHFIIGRKRDGNWEYSIKEGYVRTFRYEGGSTSLSEQEIALRILRNIIDLGYMPKNKIKIKDNFFKKDW